jgi:hypothetical protein
MLFNNLFVTVSIRFLKWDSWDYIGHTISVEVHWSESMQERRCDQPKYWMLLVVQYAGGARFKLLPEQAGNRNTAQLYATSFSNWTQNPMTLYTSFGIEVLSVSCLCVCVCNGQYRGSPLPPWCWNLLLSTNIHLWTPTQNTLNSTKLYHWCSWPPYKPHLSFQHQYQLT